MALLAPVLIVRIQITEDADIHVGGRQFVKYCSRKRIRRMLKVSEVVVLVGKELTERRAKVGASSVTKEPRQATALERVACLATGGCMVASTCA